MTVGTRTDFAVLVPCMVPDSCSSPPFAAPPSENAGRVRFVNAAAPRPVKVAASRAESTIRDAESWSEASRLTGRVDS